VDDVNEICNTECQNNATQLTYTASGYFKFYDPVNDTTTYRSSDNYTGLSGDITCYPGYSCKVRSASFTGSASGLFEPFLSSNASSSKRRRLATTEDAIRNPVMCLEIGESMVFDLDLPDHYPVYVKKSLLNHNEDFDYSSFELLKTQENYTNITTFAFTFTEPGNYLFEDASDSTQQMLIGVMANGTTCPYDSPIQPRTAASLQLISTKQETDLVLSINWWAVLGVMLVLLLSIIVCAALFYYYNKLSWMLPEKKNAAYRERQKQFFIEGDLTLRTQEVFYLDGEQRSDADAMFIRDLIFKDIPENGVERSTFTDENDDIDSSILQAILDQLRDCQKTLLRELQKPTTDKLIEELKAEFDALQEAVQRQLKDISMPPHLKAIFDQDLLMLEDPSYTSETATPAGELDYLALQRIAADPGLAEFDRQRLMDEMNTQLKKLDQNLNPDRSAHDSDLQRRLREREARRAQLASERQRLEDEEKNLTKLHDEELRHLAMNQNYLEEQRMKEDKEDRDAARRELIGPEADALKQRIDAAIQANPAQRDRLLKEYEDSLKLMEQNLSMNQLKQQQDLARRLEERKRNRKRTTEQEVASLRNKTEERHAQEISALAQRKRDLAVEEALAATASTETSNELESLDSKHKQEQNDLLRTLNQQEDQLTSALMRKKTMLADTKSRSRLAGLEAERERLTAALATADEATRIKLLSELQANKEATADLMQKQSDKQKTQLEARLTLRRKKRQEQMEQLKMKQQQEKDEAEARVKEAEARKRTEASKAAIEKLKAELRPDELPEAIRALLAAKHQEELDRLLKTQARRTRIKLRDLLEETLREKGDDLQALRQEFKDRRTQIEENAAILGAAEVEAQLRILEQQEGDALARLDFAYMKKSEEQQERAMRDLVKQNNDEVLALVERQLAECQGLLAKSGLTKEQKMKIHAEMKDKKAALEEENKDRMAEIARKNLQLQADKEVRNKELEALIKQEREQIEEDRKHLMSQQKRRQLADRRRKLKEELQRGHLTEEEIEKLLADEQQKLAKIDSALAREREKQQAKLHQKLAEKRGKQKETQEQLTKMRQEQDELSAALMKAPPLSHAEAQNLLLRWRRYPKKQHKDVLSSISSKEHTAHWYPVQTNQVKAQVVSKSKTLRELVERVDRIEAIATNVDSVQFEQARKAFSGLSSALS
jgi:hypothetical protein